jgi:hypothetical protein
MIKGIEEQEKVYLIETINDLVIRITGESLSETQIAKKLTWSVDKLREEKDNKLFAYKVYNTGWN